MLGGKTSIAFAILNSTQTCFSASFIGNKHPKFIHRKHPDYGKIANPSLEDYLKESIQGALKETNSMYHSALSHIHPSFDSSSRKSNRQGLGWKFCG